MLWRFKSYVGESLAQLSVVYVGLVFVMMGFKSEFAAACAFTVIDVFIVVRFY